MRLIKALIALVFVGFGVVFGALNRQAVQLDGLLGIWNVRLGFLVLLALLAGALVGGLAVTAGVVWPLRRQLRKTVASSSVEPTP